MVQDFKRFEQEKFRFGTSLLALDGTSSLALDSVPLFEPLRHRRICLRSWAVHWWYRLAASGRFRAGYLCSAYGCTELPRSHRSGSHNANVVGALGLGPQCAFGFGGNVRSVGPTMVVVCVGSHLWIHQLCRGRLHYRNLDWSANAIQREIQAATGARRAR